MSTTFTVYAGPNIRFEGAEGDPHFKDLIWDFTIKIRERLSMIQIDDTIRLIPNVEMKDLKRCMQWERNEDLIIEDNPNTLNEVMLFREQFWNELQALAVLLENSEYKGEIVWSIIPWLY